MYNTFHLVKLAAHPPQRRLPPFSEGPARPHDIYIVRIWAPIAEEPTAENDCAGRPTSSEKEDIHSLRSQSDDSLGSYSRKVRENGTWIVCTALWFSVVAVFLFNLWFLEFGSSSTR